jgi:hypothetical protein
LQAPSLYAAEPYHLTTTVGAAAPVSPSDVVLVFHSSDPTLNVWTDMLPLDNKSTVTDSQGTTVTFRLWNHYTPVSAAESFTRQISLYEWKPETAVTVTAEVVDEKSGQVESSTAASTVSMVLIGSVGSWQAQNGALGYNQQTMPLAEQTRGNTYDLMLSPSASPALPAVYPTFTFSAAQLKAAGYTAPQLAGALQVQAAAGLDGTVERVMASTVGADGSLAWRLPAVDLPASGVGLPDVNLHWVLSLYATCAIPAGTMAGAVQLHAADGTVLSGLSQTFAIQRHDCLTHDFTGDGKPDLLARDRSGVLWLYPGTGRPSAPYGRRIKVSAGWGGYTSLVAAGDLTGDGHDDLVARDRAGLLWLYRGTGQATHPFLARLPIPLYGYRVSANLVADGALSDDGEADLVDAGNPGMVFYGTGKAAAPFSDMVGAGLPLGSYTAVAGAGVVDWLPRFAARDRAGVLWLVSDPILGTPTPARVRLGGGWQAYNTILQAGDIAGSGHDDLLARDAAGRLWRYTGTGRLSGAFLPRTLLGSGWQIYDLLV